MLRPCAAWECSVFIPSKVEVRAFSVLVTQAVVLETAVDRQVLHLTGDAVAHVTVLACTPLFPLATTEGHTVCKQLAPIMLS